MPLPDAVITESHVIDEILDYVTAYMSFSTFI